MNDMSVVYKKLCWNDLFTNQCFSLVIQIYITFTILIYIEALTKSKRVLLMINL